jgi:hypothetical protein
MAYRKGVLIWQYPFTSNIPAMYVVREIFHLQFGRYREAKALFDQMAQAGVMNLPAGSRILTDFTGEGYRLIMESPYAGMADFEAELKKELGGADWQQWYEKFKPLVRYSEREILKVISTT